CAANSGIGSGIYTGCAANSGADSSIYTGCAVIESQEYKKEAAAQTRGGPVFLRLLFFSSPYGQKLDEKGGQGQYRQKLRGREGLKIPFPCLRPVILHEAV
ncbi:hypothetical protein, partial [Anaerotruncus colihominis]|uniref:hypothetical protein n=1 Tax=Anaerotruncus colihominis TaxID=169435 RepID=UPI0026EFD5F4